MQLSDIILQFLYKVPVSYFLRELFPVNGIKNLSLGKLGM
jgi:hypothetical protein